MNRAPSRLHTPNRLRRFRRLALFALVLATSIVAVLNVPAATGAKPGGAPGIYWGAQIGDQLTGEQAPWDMNAVTRFEQLAGKNLSLVSFNTSFNTCAGKTCVLNPFPSTPMESIREHGAIPVFGWSTSSVEGNKDPKFALSKIIHGRYDGYIRTFARAAAAWGHPFFLRFDWEMNGNWFPWAEGVNGNKRGEYVAAWRHVHDIFTSVGATNATWVWCPNIGHARHLKELYPGNRYVDWTCIDGYNWGKAFDWAHWQSFKQSFGTSYASVRKVAPSKPMMLGEVASTDKGGSKVAWIDEMLTSIPKKYPKIRAWVWFEVEDRGTNWPIESSPAVTKAFAKGVRNPVYVGNEFGDIGSSPIAPPRR